MAHKLIEQLYTRCENDKQDSDFAYFWALLLTAEAMVKTIVLGLLAAVEDDTQRNRYRLIYHLVRANGVGDWSRTLEDALTGPSSHSLIREAQWERKELTKFCAQGEWQYEAVILLKRALDELGIEAEAVGNRTNLTRWFRVFATLRNKTRGHGATPLTRASEAAEFLFRSVDAIFREFHLFQRPWVYMRRNLSGKYRVTVVGNKSEHFDHFKKEADHSLANGLYIFFDSPRLVPLIESDPELSDFFLPNGDFNKKNFTLLSYLTDDKRSEDSTPFLAHPDVRVSETHGHGELLPKGNCFSNVPETSRDYIQRDKLESELLTLLMDRRRPVVTLQGAGGVGKTSVTLQVIEKLYEQDRFEMIVWFSSRDIDLLPSGPRTVRPAVLSPEDIATLYSSLVLPKEKIEKRKSGRKTYFEEQLAKPDGGVTLFIFDNFETVQNPVEMFDWIEEFINFPNKVLITTRLRDFRGDYPLEVHGMTEQEARILIKRTASSLGIWDLLDESRISELIKRSWGHPYVMKILLGQMAVTKRFGTIRRVVAGMDGILTALFARTFEALSPCGKRAFLTLAAWNSAVPRVALEAVLIHSTGEVAEVEKGIETLLQYSLAETRVTAEENQEFIGLPLAASEFGKKKLNVDILQPSVLADVQILQMFAPSLISDANLNLNIVLERFIRKLSDRIDNGGNFDEYEPILSMVCQTYNPGWLLLARWRLERGSSCDVDEAMSNIRRFLESDPTGPDAPQAWQMLARAYQRKGDSWGEVFAYIRRAQIDSVPFYDVSNTANLLNRNYSTLEPEYDAKRQLTEQLLNVLEKRMAEAGPDDLSRMAWLALHLGLTEKARRFAEAGLQIDGGNTHCLGIVARLDSNIY